MSTLLRSQIECRSCGQVIASIFRHDFQTCDCGKTSIDGGRDYQRVVSDAPPLDRSLIVPYDLVGDEAAHVLHVYKALLEAEGLSGEHPVRTDFVVSVFNHNALRRPIMNMPLHGYAKARIRRWLGMLEEAGAVEAFRNDSNYLCFRSRLPWADHPEA